MKLYILIFVTLLATNSYARDLNMCDYAAAGAGLASQMVSEVNGNIELAASVKDKVFDAVMEEVLPSYLYDIKEPVEVHNPRAIINQASDEDRVMIPGDLLPKLKIVARVGMDEAFKDPAIATQSTRWIADKYYHMCIKSIRK